MYNSIPIITPKHQTSMSSQTAMEELLDICLLKSSVSKSCAGSITENALEYHSALKHTPKNPGDTVLENPMGFCA